MMATAEWPKHVVGKSYTLDNTDVLWLLYPYRIIALHYSVGPDRER